MPLRLTSKGAVRFSWADETMEAIWTLRPEDTQDELMSKMKQIVAFIESQGPKAPLPERTPGLALEMTKMAHPAPPGNGWAAMVPPELPEDRKGEWELMPSEEQDNG
ncbi:hypothetical protein HCJ93_08300 [Streptomyces sp. SBST2-5]|jgi:hypothetical protein|uniref:Uncharacterized protein n=1 Tax=Streptomyces composti TaxID=2720025 RepID=A0ABX1A4T6_9ACTN|nr:hypothetical protein [Streptomyces composti]NJP50072.1 hypothetical protein [Streptomyces composti]